MNEKTYLATRASVLDGHYLWFSEYYFNSLFRMDLYSGLVEHIGVFPDAGASSRELHIGAFVCGDEVIFTPYVSGLIHIFNKATKKFETIQVPDENFNAFCQGVYAGDTITFISEKGTVFSYWPQQKIIQKNEEITARLINYLKKYGSIKSFYVDECSISMQVGKNIVRYIVQKNEMNQFELQRKSEEIESLLFVDDNSCIFEAKGDAKIICVGLKNGETKELSVGECKWGKNFCCNAYSKIYKNESFEIVVNYNASEPLILDDKKERVKTNSVHSDLLYKTVWGPIYQDVHFFKNKAYIIPCSNKNVIVCDLVTKTINKMPFSIDKNRIKNINGIIKNQIDKNGVLREEEELFSMKTFVDYVTAS